MKKLLKKALNIIEMQNISLLEQLHIYQHQDTVVDAGYYPNEQDIEDELINTYCVQPESNMVH